MKNIERTREYFDRNAEFLRHMKKTKQSVITKTTASMLKGRLKGQVLDIGSGASIEYDIRDVDHLVALDSSLKSPKNDNREKGIEYVRGDARKLTMEDCSFDCVVVLHTIHHLAGDNISETWQNLYDCLRESHRVLKNGGRIFIIDAVCTVWAQKLENLFYKTALRILWRLHKPMVYYFSAEGITDALRKSGFRIITCTGLDTGSAPLCPCTSRTGIPFRFTPFSHVYIEAAR